VKARRKAQVDAAEAKNAANEALKAKDSLVEEAAAQKKELLWEMAAVKEAAGESEALREQVVAQSKELSALQRKLFAAETEAGAGTKKLEHELESVKEKSKQYIKKAVDQQKVLQGRVRELEEQLQRVRGDSERARMDALLTTTKAQDADTELAAARADKEAAEAKLIVVTSEYDRYKMRAHTLLKKADENGAGGGRDITGTLDDLTRQLADKESQIRTLREQTANLEKQRMTAEQAAADCEHELNAVRTDLDTLESTRAAEGRILNLKIDSLQKDGTSIV
jgi:chromosome segregation ATPase